MAINEQDGYVTGSYDNKGANDVLRDITGQKLSASEIKNLKKVFSDGAMNEFFQGDDKEPGETPDVKTAGTDPSIIAAAFTTDTPAPGSPSGNESGPQNTNDEQAAIKADTPHPHFLDTGIVLSEFGETHPDFEEVSTTDAMYAMETTVELVAAGKDVKFRDQGDDGPDVDDKHNSHAHGYFSALVTGSGEAALYRIARDVVQGFGVEDIDSDERARRRINDQQMMMETTLATLDAQIAAIDARIGEIDTRLAEIDLRIEEIDQRVAEIDTRIEEIDATTDALQTEMATLVAENETLALQSLNVTSDMTGAQALVEKTSIALAAAQSELDASMENAITSKDGHLYAKSEDGSYVYVSGPDEGSVVPDEQRASWWNEITIFGQAAVAEDILGGKDAVAREEEAHTQATENLAGMRTEAKTLADRISADNARISEIQTELGQLGLEKDALKKERTDLLLERTDLTEEQRALLEERKELEAQKEALIEERKQYASSYLVASDSAILQDGLSQNRNEITAAMSAENYDQIDRLVKERDALKSAISDMENGVTVDASKLPASVQQELALSHVTGQMDFYGEVDISTIPEEYQDAAATSMLGHENSASYLASLEMNIDKFSPDIQRQIIDRVIEQDMELGREIDTQVRFAKTDLQDYADQKIATYQQTQSVSIADASTGTSRTATSAAGSDIQSPVDGSLSDAYAYAGEPRDVALDVEQPAPAPTEPAPNEQTQTVQPAKLGA